MPVEISGRLLFFHVPKTGGTFVRQLLEELRLPTRTIGHPHDYPDQLPEARRNRVAFCVYRPPVSWLVSYWGYKQVAGWDQANPFDQECAADTLDGFLRLVLTWRPGWASQVAQRFARGVDRVLVYPYLTEGVAHLLGQHNLADPRDVFEAARKIGRANNSDCVNRLKQLDGRLVEAIEAAEAWEVINSQVQPWRAAG